jgi:dTMP kinase
VAKRGRFITLEGGEGVGKSTQLLALAEQLRAKALTVLTTREPGGSEGAEAIRALLMEGGADRWSARSEALLFAAARADHVERKIRPALEDGHWVLCDRFVDSSRAYQGGAGGLSDDDVMTLHRIGSEGLLPDRTLILTLTLSDAQARALARDGGEIDRFAQQKEAYHSRVGAAFLRFATADADRFRLIDASGDVDDVTSRLVESVSDLM